MTQTGRIPTTVITGFLGAGKTATVRHLLQTANGKRLALIINEFGDLAIDGEILKGCGIEECPEDAVMELANGCICCTVADDFVPTMEALLNRPQAPDHIVIETSGLALPKPLVKAFNWPEIRNRVTVDGVIAVVDGPAVLAGRFASDPSALAAQRAADDALDHDSPLEELLEEQLGCADLVLLNKTEDMSAADLARLRAQLAPHMRAGVKVVTASYGAIDAAILLGLGAAAEDDLATRKSHVDNGEDHDHDDFTSFVVRLNAIDAPQTLLARLQPLVDAHDILRIKGFAAVAGKDMRLVVQGVGGRFQHYYDRDWRADEARETCLVVIGQTGMDETAIRARLEG